MIPIEIKCVSPEKHMTWVLESKGIIPRRLLGADNLPKEHKVQCHGSMVVMDADKMIFQAYCPGLPDLVVEVCRDDYTDKLAENLKRFVSELEAAAEKVGAPSLGDIPWQD